LQQHDAFEAAREELIMQAAHGHRLQPASVANLEKKWSSVWVDVVSMLVGWYSRLTAATYAPPVFQSGHDQTASNSACQAVCKRGFAHDVY